MVRTLESPRPYEQRLVRGVSPAGSCRPAHPLAALYRRPGSAICRDSPNTSSGAPPDLCRSGTGSSQQAYEPSSGPSSCYMDPGEKSTKPGNTAVPVKGAAECLEMSPSQSGLAASTSFRCYWSQLAWWHGVPMEHSAADGRHRFWSEPC